MWCEFGNLVDLFLRILFEANVDVFTTSFLHFTFLTTGVGIIAFEELNGMDFIFTDVNVCSNPN
jgi:hypothetical protein